MDAALIGEHFSESSFDLVVSTLVFSELPPDERRYVLEACKKLLAPQGRLLIADEVAPSRPLAKLLFYLVRLPLVLLTWLLTCTSTSAIRDFDELLRRTGLRTRRVASYLGKSLVLYESVLPETTQSKDLTEDK
jgi:SAM-dependent methyltransferase